MDRRDVIFDLRRDILRALGRRDPRPLDNTVYNPTELASTPSEVNVMRRTLLLLEELT